MQTFPQVPCWDSVTINIMPESQNLAGDLLGTGFRASNPSLPIAATGQMPCPVGLPSLSHLFPGYVNGFQRSDSGSILPGLASANGSATSNDLAARWSTGCYPPVLPTTPVVAADGSIFNVPQPPGSAPGCYDFGASSAMPHGYSRFPSALGAMPSIPYAMGSGLAGPLFSIQPIHAHFPSVADLVGHPFLYPQSMGMGAAATMPVSASSLALVQEPVLTPSQSSDVSRGNPFLVTSSTQASPADTVPDPRPTNAAAAPSTVSPQQWLNRPSGTLAGLEQPAPAPLQAQQTHEIAMSDVSHEQVHQDSDSRTGSRGSSKRPASKMAGDGDSDEEVESGTVQTPLFPHDSVDEALAVEYPHFHTITDMRERRLIRNRIAAKACRARKKEVVDDLARRLDEERTTAAQLRTLCSNLERENSRLALELDRVMSSSHTAQPEKPSERTITAPNPPKTTLAMDQRVPLEMPGRPLVMFTTVIPGVTASAAARMEGQAHSDEPSDSGSQDGLDLLLFAAQHVDYLDFTAVQPPPSEVYQQKAVGFRV